jgi:prepilin-type N-terminal cleavage/methylation domain-containing protein/prepilin-type processing-associated H-X9-DG protein
MKKAFTLVELLVVIGILGILSAVLIGSFSGGTESARNAKCLTNMKNLASACQSYGMTHAHYPLAGSVERVRIDSSDPRNVKMQYSELPGWLSWNSENAYAGGSTSSHVANPGWFVSTYDQTAAVREHCCTNGSLWKYLSGNRGIFQCPAHVKKFGKNPPAWSYVMNSYFGWAGANASPKDGSYYGIHYGDLARADRRLLFAEIPYMGVETAINTTESAGTECDCVLQYRSKDGGEMIGFNHSSGKRSKFAHVVFADGHAEKLVWPKDGLNEARVRELTEWLCTATDVTFTGKDYEELK